MDVVFVTYNSEKWINGCFSSLEKASLDKLNVYVADNHSTDSTRKKLDEWKRRWPGKFEILYLDKNLGFGVANNQAAALGSDSHICFLNIDTQIYEDTFKKLEEEFDSSSGDVAVWELRQLPYEHPKVYDPVNGYVSWCSGAAFAIKRSVFEEVGGFDGHIFMYGEDVDLSWRIRNKGYFLKYCPTISIQHYSYQYAEEFKKTQFIYGIKNNLFLRYRFGSIKDILVGHLLFATVLFGKNPEKGLRKELLLNYLHHFKEISYWIKSRSTVKGCFLRWEYEYQRDGAYLISERGSEREKVSIIVRTCGRPDVLRETMQSLAHQTYRNVEIIVVEDGPNISQKMLENEFGNLDIHYFCTGEKKGRSRAGNIGLANSSGKYINFLDDDDLFFHDHIEVLVNALEKSVEEAAAYSFALETAIEVENQSPYIYQIKRVNKRYTEDFDKIMLCHHNYIPIQCIMFDRRLFEKLGGLDEKLEYLEDWDLWVRYATKTEFLCVPKTTSIYRVPYNQNVQNVRQRQLDEALIKVRKKHEKYYMSISVSDIARLWEEEKFWRKWM